MNDALRNALLNLGDKIDNLREVVMSTKTKTARPRTLNRGAADNREYTKDWAKRYCKSNGVNSIPLSALLRYLSKQAEVAKKRKGGM